MTAIRLEARDLQRTLRKGEVEIFRAFKRGVKSGALKGMRHLENITPVDTGQLKGAWSIPASADDGPGGQTIRNSAPHAGIVEEGARPHKVNQAGRFALLRWVSRHFPDQTEQDWQRIVQGICNKLEKFGQKPTYFVKGALPELEAMVKAEIEREFAKVRPSVVTGPKGSK